MARLAQEPFALVFSGQGFDWMKTLRASVAQGAGRTVAPLVDQANSLLEGVYDEIAGMQPYGFDPIAWAQQDSVPFDTVQASLSVPGIFTSQLATLDLLESQGLDIESARTVIGHSQGVLGIHAAKDLTRAAPFRDHHVVRAMTTTSWGLILTPPTLAPLARGLAVQNRLDYPKREKSRCWSGAIGSATVL